MPAAVVTDDAILQRFTGQTAVRDPLIAAASKRSATVRRELRRARIELYYRVVRTVPVRLRAEPWVVALVTCTAAALGTSLLLFFAFGIDRAVVIPWRSWSSAPPSFCCSATSAGRRRRPAEP
jgi:hypothetical protein